MCMCLDGRTAFNKETGSGTCHSCVEPVLPEPRSCRTHARIQCKSDRLQVIATKIVGRKSRRMIAIDTLPISKDRYFDGFCVACQVGGCENVCRPYAGLGLYHQIG